MKGRNAKETVASNQNLTDGADALGRLRPLHRPLEGPLRGSLMSGHLRPG